ncbi:class II lanthipeptide, LchA2/BrtA2 family [Streptococcus pneumoniae]|nr:class II lanthipeptide, LchA2/BrtA2 family [Streptococcus pneumoniae]
MNNKFTGKINELELEQLVGDNQVVGGITPTIIPATISFVGVTFTVTLNGLFVNCSGLKKS